MIFVPVKWPKGFNEIKLSIQVPKVSKVPKVKEFYLS